MPHNYKFNIIKTSKQLEEAFRLRFQVYCTECHFINARDHVDGFEKDELDDHSVHFGAFDQNGQMIGFTRLILPTCKKFPIEERSKSLNFFESKKINRKKCAEISRFVITKQHKQKRHFFSREISLDYNKKEFFTERVSPVWQGLSRLIYMECQERGIEHCFAFMERTLCVLARKNGYCFEPIGSEVDFYGVVRPYLIDVKHHERRALENNSK